MYTDTIKKTVNDTKTKDEWQQDIYYLTKRFDYLSVGAQMHVPDGWEGDKWVNLPEFTIVEEGKEIICDGMWKEKYGWFSIRVKSEDPHHHPTTIQLYQIQNMESYRTVVKTLLRAIDDFFEWQNEWMEE